MGGQFATYIRPRANPEVFDLFEYGSLIFYQGQYLSLVLTDPQHLAVCKLQTPHWKPPPEAFVLPHYEWPHVFDWQVNGNSAGAPERWARGKLVSYDSQNGWYSATTLWNGGGTVPFPGPATAVRITVTDPHTGTEAWKVLWYAGPRHH